MSIKKALSYMLLRNNDAEISNFFLKHILKREVGSTELKWRDNSSIPFPYRIAEVKNNRRSTASKTKNYNFIFIH